MCTLLCNLLLHLYTHNLYVPWSCMLRFHYSDSIKFWTKVVISLRSRSQSTHNQNPWPGHNYSLPFLCPRHKMARGHLVFALSVLPSFRHSVASNFVFSTPPTSLHGFEWNLVQMLYHKSWSACGEIIHVQQILAELWSLTLRIFTHFSLSSQLLLHPCMDLNETWQG